MDTAKYRPLFNYIKHSYASLALELMAKGLMSLSVDELMSGVFWKFYSL